MNIFLIAPSSEQYVSLSRDESMHCIRVLRYKESDEITLVDGEGGFYKGRIVNADPKACRVKIDEVKKGYGKRRASLHIAIAPTKNISRFEWFLEKATEIGIEEITPMICQRSERRDIKTERLHKVLVEAMKQSIKAYLPTFNPPRAFQDFIGLPFNAEKFICVCDLPDDALLKKRLSSGSNTVILIGPEGDFTEEEISLAVEAGFSLTSLGTSRLRTETAGMVACTTFQILNQ